MPNQRSKNKVRLGGFVDRKLYEEVVRLARREGMADNKFGFAQKLILEALGRYPKAKTQSKRRLTARSN